MGHSSGLIRHPTSAIRHAVRPSLAAAAALAFLTAGVAQAQPIHGRNTEGWVGTWNSAQVTAATSGLSATGFSNQTVRNIVHTSVGGSKIRIRISNVFGIGPLDVSDVHVGLRQSGAAVFAGTDRQVTFHGRNAVAIAAGDRAESDPIDLEVGDEQDLAVSIYFAGSSGPATWHPDAISTNYVSTSGDHGAEADATAYTTTDTSWYFLDGVDVLNPTVAGAVVAFGPSTTDGDASTTDANARYPDDLARRLLKLLPGQQLSVLNAGISGNQLLADGGTSGAAGLTRFQRDALEQTGVRAIIIWEGTNDIGDDPTLIPSQLTNGYQQLINEAHQRGVRVIGATLQPDQGASYYTPQGNTVREAVNTWIRTSGAFDGVADFDAVLRDPSDPAQMQPVYDSGDHLHPNDTGYLAIADSINLQILTGNGPRPAFSGFGIANPASLTERTNGSGAETLTIQSLAAQPWTTRWVASAPRGVTVEPADGEVELPANGTATVSLTVGAGSKSGAFPVSVDLFADSDESALTVPFTVYSQQPGDLTPFYNNIGISDDGAVGQANLDGGGYSYSEQLLTAAGLAPGAAVTVGGLNYTWPNVAAGQPDNVQAAGQTIVPRVAPAASVLGFLGTGANSGTTGTEGTLTINYSDGSTAQAQLGLSGYALGFADIPPDFGNTIVVTLPYRNYTNGTNQDSNMYVFATTIPLDSTRTVESITLPSSTNHGQLHIFALSHP
jgi:lysophospholipase L1-like esterase